MERARSSIDGSTPTSRRTSATSSTSRSAERPPRSLGLLQEVRHLRVAEQVGRVGEVVMG
jgi:hypothetical protein